MDKWLKVGSLLGFLLKNCLWIPSPWIPRAAFIPLFETSDQLQILLVIFDGLFYAIFLN